MMPLVFLKYKFHFIQCLNLPKIYHISLGMYQRIFIFLLIIVTLSFFNTGDVVAQERKEGADNPYFNNSGLPLPRFISLASGKVYLRAGPGLRYPIRWIYTKKGMPIEVIQEFDTWRKVRDVDGDEGWVHQSLLSGRRSGIVTADENITLYKKPNLEAKSVAIIEPNVVIPLKECEKDWCKSEIQGFDGWVEKKFIWGVYAESEFD